MSSSFLPVTVAFILNAANADAATIGAALNNQAQAWFRIVALSGTTGSDNRDSFAIDYFSITTIPESSAAVLTALGLLGILRRRR
jgi:hypothetical protein